MSFRDRIADGAPLRMGEFAEYIGYTRQTVWKMAKCGALSLVRAYPGGERRVPVEEAERIGRELKLLS